MNAMGISFSPLGDADDPTRRREGSGGVPTPQQAIRMLALRMPRVVGASAPAPPALLAGQGAARFGTSGLPLEFLLETLFGRRPTPTGRFEYPGLQASWQPPSGSGMPEPPGGGGNGNPDGTRFGFNDRPEGSGETIPTPRPEPLRPPFDRSGFPLSGRRQV